MLPYQKTILTPHRGEFYKIFKEKLPEDVDKAKEIVTRIARGYHTTLLVKGRVDIISNGVSTKTNITGHPGMTVGGTGDVLSGITAELYSIIKDSFIAASLAAYLSGKAGEKAAEKFGDGLMASDVPEHIYEVIKEAKNFQPKEF